jgi:hypothetical protein
MNTLRRLAFLVAMFLLSLLAALADAQTVKLTASHITSGASPGTPFTGKLCFVPANNGGAVINFQYGGGGQGTTQQSCYLVTNGVLQSGITVPDTALTNPLNLCLYAQLINPTQPAQKQNVGTYSCIQPASSGQSSWCSGSGTSTVCNLDNYTPSLATLVVQQTGPTGPQGPPGAGYINGLTSDGSNGISVAGNIAAQKFNVVGTSTGKWLNNLNAQLKAAAIANSLSSFVSVGAGVPSPFAKFMDIYPPGYGQWFQGISFEDFAVQGAYNQTTPINFGCALCLGMSNINTSQAIAFVSTRANAATGSGLWAGYLYATGFPGDGYNLSGPRLIWTGAFGPFTQIDPSTSSFSMTTSGLSANVIANFLATHGLSSGRHTLIQVGLDTGNYDAVQLGWQSTGTANSTGAFAYLGLPGIFAPFAVFGTGDVTINSQTDNGFKLEVNGTEKVDGPLTAASTVTLGQHLNQSASKNIAGTCAMTSGTCSAQSFSAGYSNTPSCTCSWNGSGTLTGLLKCANGVSSITPASTVSTDTAVVAWMCVGNPN